MDASSNRVPVECWCEAGGECPPDRCLRAEHAIPKRAANTYESIATPLSTYEAGAAAVDQFADALERLGDAPHATRNSAAMLLPTVKYRYDRGERIVTIGARRLGASTLDGWIVARFGPRYTGATGHHLSLEFRWMGRNGR